MLSILGPTNLDAYSYCTETPRVSRSPPSLKPLRKYLSANRNIFLIVSTTAGEVSRPGRPPTLSYTRYSTFNASSLRDTMVEQNRLDVNRPTLRG